jgi:uncharacterized cupin superfamily protein
MPRPNVFSGEFTRVREEMGVRGMRLGPAAGARELGASVYELAPGASGFNLHAHYANEELFVVLRGAPSLRTEQGEQQLAEGDVVACPRGRAGAHTICNSSAQPALVLALSTANYPDVALYPELGRVAVATRHPHDPAEPGDGGLVAQFDLPADGGS